MTKKQQSVNDMKQSCMVKKTGKNNPPTQVGTGYLSMVLNQRQQLTAASDWEPYQAKHIEIQHTEQNE